MVADKGKKAKVVERGEEQDSEHIDGELVLSIEKLQEIQDELERVNEEASDKVLEVEQKYNEIRGPVYKMRNEIIKSIPDFWLTAFLSHPALCDLVTEEDQKIFKYLESLDVEDFKDLKSGYSITFSFSPNPYFEDTSLKKTYSFFDNGITNITGTAIRWKEEMLKNTANGVAYKKNGNKRPFPEESLIAINSSAAIWSNVLRIAEVLGYPAYFVLDRGEHQCFFSWFGETQQKSISEGFSDEVAEIIKEDLWPNPLKYFNNEADEEDFDGDEDDEEGTDSEDDDVQGDEDDDEEDDS